MKKLNLSRRALTRLLGPILFLLLGSRAALAAEGWASIAYNQTTQVWGEAHGYATLSGAEAAAQNACGEGCAIVAWVHNGYIALATGDGGWGVSDGQPTAEEATNVAVNQCGSVTTNCAWRIWSSGFDE